MGNVLGLDHVSVIVKDAEHALKFYQTVLGLEVLPRPELGFPGYWLDLGHGQSLHIMQLPDPDSESERPLHGGRDRHFALRVDSIDAFAEQLEQMELEFTRSRSGRRALFTRDPDENALELFEWQS